MVNYRLSPAVSHPAHIEDAAASFAWVKRHIAEYGGDPNQIFVVGHSAGAYLLALLATDERYLAAHGLSARDIRGLVPVSAFFWVERSGVAPVGRRYVAPTRRYRPTSSRSSTGRATRSKRSRAARRLQASGTSTADTSVSAGA